MSILKVDHLCVDYRSRTGHIRLVDDVSFDIQPNKTLAIVGESGCGKSMTALAMMRLLPDGATITKGVITLQGTSLTDLPEAQMRDIRGASMSMIFQEPMTSLNPVFNVGEQIAEVLRLHTDLDKQQVREKVQALIRSVGISDASQRSSAYPHELSGGMRQRIMIAMALACSPKVLIADEPTTALDVTVQAQIFSLLRDLQARTSTAIVLITHDMGVVAEMADDIIVMYAGRLAERGSVETVLSQPAHPYTRGLIDCVPHLQLGSNISHKPVTEIPGVVPALETIGAGCPFASRCGLSEERCEAVMPELLEVRPSHQVACWNSQEA